MRQGFDCTHFSLLRRRFDELSLKFLNPEMEKELADPAQFQADNDNLAAFRLLMHAEIETFLEERAGARLSSISRLISEGKSWERENPQLFALITFNRPVWDNHASTETVDQKLLVKQIIEACKRQITENNSIKEGAFTRLSVMAGKTVGEVDPSTAALLNSYGKERGLVAHRSTSKVRSLQAPSAELANARTIVEALKEYFSVQALPPHPSTQRFTLRKRFPRGAPARDESPSPPGQDIAG